MFQFTIQIKQAGQLFFGIIIDNISSCSGSPFIHSHIQSTFKPERKATATVIKMMTGNTQISQNTVYLRYIIISHPVLQIAEIAPDKSQSFVIRHIPFRISILIKAEKPA